MIRDVSEIPALLRNARKAAGVTQQALAATIGLSSSSVSTFERGLRVPRWRYRRRMQDALGMDRHALASIFDIVGLMYLPQGYIADAIAPSEGGGMMTFHHRRWFDEVTA